jgi:hypothetical protein
VKVPSSQSLQLNIHLIVEFAVELTDVSTGIQTYPKFKHVRLHYVTQKLCLANRNYNKIINIHRNLWLVLLLKL